ncbi:MAG: hypothetical protein ACJZ8O_07410 [Pirellulaceae bacterium]
MISGPCVIESSDLTMRIAEHLKETCEELPVHFVFKASFDKANRTSIHSYRGPGLDEGLTVLERVRDCLGVSVTTEKNSTYLSRHYQRARYAIYCRFQPF